MKDLSIIGNGKMYTGCENGKPYKKLEFASGNFVKVPVNKDGSVKWFDDSKLIKKVG